MQPDQNLSFQQYTAMVHLYHKAEHLLVCGLWTHLKECQFCLLQGLLDKMLCWHLPFRVLNARKIIWLWHKKLIFQKCFLHSQMVRGWHLWQQVSRELAQWMGLTPRGSFQGTIEPGWQAGIPFSHFLESNCLESCATFSVQFWFTLLLLSPPEETSQFPLIPSPSSDTIHSAYRWSTLCAYKSISFLRELETVVIL